MNHLKYLKTKLDIEFLSLLFMIKAGGFDLSRQVKEVDELIDIMITEFNYVPDQKAKFDKILDALALQNPKNLVNFHKYEFSKN
ncbi:MAG: hypothetical protein WC139_13275 [Candidatus Kapaibacterium sp.]